MQRFGWGIAGTGMIAGVVARAIGASATARLAAVGSRDLGRGRAFAAEHPGAEAVVGIPALLAHPGVEAVYVATPTSTKEAIALAAIAAGKHVLVDKPMIDAASVRRMTEAAAAAGLVFLDATHFVHHPRNQAVRAAVRDELGGAVHLHAALHIPPPAADNIRLDPAREPMGALGDLGWYTARAAVEYLEGAAEIASVVAVGTRDPNSGALLRVSGALRCANGATSSFDAGFTSGSTVMDIALSGPRGVITLDDFVLNWTNSFARQNPAIPTGFSLRRGEVARDAFRFVETPSSSSQETRMVERFVELARTDDRAARAGFARATLLTQGLLDRIWSALPAA